MSRSTPACCVCNDNVTLLMWPHASPCQSVLCLHYWKKYFHLPIIGERIRTDCWSTTLKDNSATVRCVDNYIPNIKCSLIALSLDQQPPGPVYGVKEKSF